MNKKLCARYADACNRLDPSNLDAELLALKRELEHRFAQAAMDEYGWERGEDGKWHYVSPEEFWQGLEEVK